MLRWIRFSMIFIFLTGCTATLTPTPPDQNAIATEVAVQLTASELAKPSPAITLTNTLIPVASPTSTPEQPTVTASPTLTETPTSTPTTAPTSAQTSTDPGQFLGKPTWKREFQNGGQDFYLFDDSHTRAAVENGSLVMTAQTLNWMGWSLTYPKIANFYLETNATVGSCSGKDTYGLVFRSGDPSAIKGYIFYVTCDGYYAITRYDNGENLSVLGWHSTNGKIQGAGAVHRLGVWAEGNKLKLYINGQLLDQAQDDTYSSGTFGYVITASSTAGFSVSYDKVAYWLLP